MVSVPDNRGAKELTLNRQQFLDMVNNIPEKQSAMALASGDDFATS
jgi:hypothetical protein